MLLFAATERENTTNGKQAGDKHTKTTTTCDTRHAHLYNTQKAFVCYIICVIIMSHALCVLNKRGGRKRKREKGGETRKQQQQEHDGNTYIQTIKIKTRLTMERWI